VLLEELDDQRLHSKGRKAPSVRTRPFVRLSTFLFPFTARVFRPFYWVGNKAIGIMHLTKSDALGDPPHDLASDPCWKNTLVQGVALRTQWSIIQPNEAAFDWSYLDRAVALAKTYEKKVSILITAGVTAPDWVYAVGAKRFTARTATIWPTRGSLRTPAPGSSSPPRPNEKA
jgi:hypothetical protein